MSLQTPILVSNNFNLFTQTVDSCSVVDIAGNIYTSLRETSIPNYGGIQKTDVFGNTTLFLQLNSTNAPGGSYGYPTGLCFSPNGDLYYIVTNNDILYKITNFITPTPISIRQISSISIPFRIIINNQNSNIFYISSVNPNMGIYSIKSYNLSTNTIQTVFNLNQYGYNSNYGIAQDFTGTNLYIGLSEGRILKGNLSGTAVSLWLTLPELSNVIGLIFITHYTLFANTSSGYGYTIYINPTTYIGTYELYYNTTTTTIIGGLGLNSQTNFLYGISSQQLWKIYYPEKPTGYKFLYNGVETDFVDVFDTSAPVNMITGYTSAAYSGLDLGEIFTHNQGGTLVTFYKNSYGEDLGSIFRQIPTFTTNGTVSNTNPFVTSAPTNGYTYILFDSTTTSYYFNTNKPIPRLYYMIVGAGSNGQKVNISGAIPGAGGGAGGCLNNYIDNLSTTNSTVTFVDGLHTEFTTNTLSLIAQNGGIGNYTRRGSVSLNGTDLIPGSSTQGQEGVGGAGGQIAGSAPGGSVYTNAGNIGNYLTFLGDGLVSNTYFGGGGGSGAGDSVGSGGNQNGGNGGGGGGGAGLKGSNNNYGNGGIGTNGMDGMNARTNSSTHGGNAFNSIGKGYGGGGGGGGSGGNGGTVENGGTGGHGVLLLYFQ